MPKVHNIGTVFVQVTKFPYEWGSKVVVRGWTQEIEEPFRTSKPFILRLPKFKALVCGRWTGTKTEEEALSGALETREVTYDDFTEKAGWTPAPDTNTKESVEDIYARLDSMDGTFNVHDWQMYYRLAKESD